MPTPDGNAATEKKMGKLCRVIAAALHHPIGNQKTEATKPLLLPCTSLSTIYFDIPIST